mgnify:CR=1 FL=1
MDMKDLADRTDRLVQSDIRAISRAVEEVGGINLGQGICDLPTPDPLKQDARRAIEANRSVYTSHRGLPALREAVGEKLRSYNDLPITDEEEIVITAGATGAFTASLLTLLDPGDEVVLFEPYYGYHRKLVELFGAETRTIRLEAPDFGFHPEELEAAVGEATKAIVLNTPSNPSGKIWSESELEALHEVANAHGLYVLTDEIYEYMTYEGRKHISPASIPGAFEHTITISGYSKAFNMTGWRLGYAAGPEHLTEPISLINDLLYICAPTPLQHGVVEAYRMDDAYFRALQEDYAHRRRMLCETLEEVGFEAAWPEGAYYVLADTRPVAAERPGFEDDRSAARTLLEEAGVAAVPGRAFFDRDEDGAHLLRFCFAKEMDELEAACSRLRGALG